MSEWYYSERDERQGPVSLDTLQNLIQSGQVNPNELAWTEGMADWKPIRLIPELQVAPRQKTSDLSDPGIRNRTRFDPDRDIYRSQNRADAEGYERESYDDSLRSKYNKAPHRGVLILILGIVGLLFCGFVAIPAIILGKADLAEMQAGRMDPSGEGLTRAGYILGIVACVIMLLQIVLFCGMFAIMGLQ